MVHGRGKQEDRAVRPCDEPSGLGTRDRGEPHAHAGDFAGRAHDLHVECKFGFGDGGGGLARQARVVQHRDSDWEGPEGIDISPDGTEVWAAGSGDGTVTIIDTTTKKVTDTVNVGTKHSNRVKFTPRGKWVLISDLGSGELLVMDAGTRKEVKRLKLGKSAEGILIAPDDSR